MRKLGFIIILLATGFTSCLKESDKPDCSPVNVVAPAPEVEALRTYLTTNGITATEDPRGFFYIIHAAGTDKPTVCSRITVSYSGKLTNGTEFDASANFTYDLSYLITGWQEGIPFIGIGGSITLYVPPSLGYGSVDYGAIPANSILIFNIGLLGVLG